MVSEWAGLQQTSRPHGFQDSGKLLVEMCHKNSHKGPKAPERSGEPPLQAAKQHPYFSFGKILWSPLTVSQTLCLALAWQPPYWETHPPHWWNYWGTNVCKGKGGLAEGAGQGEAKTWFLIWGLPVTAVDDTRSPIHGAHLEMLGTRTKDLGTSAVGGYREGCS